MLSIAARLIAALVAFLALISPIRTAQGQFTIVINVPPEFAPSSIFSDTQLNVFEGGSIGNSFRAGQADGTSTNVEVNIFGGSVGSGFGANGGSTVNISGGTIGGSFFVNSGGLVNITGGSIGNSFSANDGSVVNISGGLVGTSLCSGCGNLNANSGSTVTVSGGAVGMDLVAAIGSVVTVSGGNLRSDLFAQNGSQVTISGGSINDSMVSNSGSITNISGGTFGRLSASSGSMMTLFGGDFRVNGTPIAGLETVGNSLSFVLPADSVLSGTFLDGTPFAFSNLDFSDSFSNGALTLQVAALPAVGPATIIVPNDAAPLGIRSGQTLIVNEGAIVGNNFNAGVGSSVQINGGEVGINFEAVGAQVSISGGSLTGNLDAFHGSNIDLSGGSVQTIHAFRHSVINVAGGSVDTSVHAYDESEVNISGGLVNGIRASAGSVVNITGGVVIAAFNNQFDADLGSQVNISGGRFHGFTDFFDAETLTFIGNDFYLDGVPLSIAGTQSLAVTNGKQLTGLLADGTPFLFRGRDTSVGPATLFLEATAVAPAGPATINVPTDPAPISIRSGQTLTVSNGGVVGDYFRLGRDSSLIVNSGGSVGFGLQAVGATITLNGGTIDFAEATQQSIVNITGGTAPGLLSLSRQSTLNISGGRVNEIELLGTANISGGSIDRLELTGSNSTINFSGGSVGLFTASIGIPPFSLSISGGEFRANGAPIGGLDSVGNMISFNLAPGSVLSGTLAEGTPFVINAAEAGLFSSGKQISLTAAALPAIGPAVINVPSDPVPLGIRNGQTLVVAEGGAVGNNFNAGAGSTVVISGGQVGDDFAVMDADLTITGGTVGSRVDAFAGTTVSISGGSVGSSFRAYGGSSVSVTGGSVGGDFNARSGSSVNISGGSLGNGFVATGSVIITGGQFGNFFRATSGSNVTISGGTFGTSFLTDSGGVVNISGGTFGNSFQVGTAVIPGGVVTISGGSFGDSFAVDAGNPLQISGGTFGSSFRALSGSVVNVSGGSFGSSFRAENGSVANISGASFGRSIRAESGGTLNITGGAFGDLVGINGSTWRISGGEFQLDGVAIGGLDTPGNSVPFNLPAGSLLSGILADGTPFAFSSLDGDSVRDGTLTLIAAALPAIGPTTITAPSDPVPLGIRSGQTLIVNSGGTVGNNFNAGAGSTLVVNGGQVGENLEALSAQITIAGGTVGNGPYFEGLSAFQNSTVTISDGMLNCPISAHGGSVVNISGGTVTGALNVNSGSQAHVSGGSIGGINSFDGSVLNISGGSIVANGVQAFNGTTVDIQGTNFVLQGVNITDTLTPNIPFEIPARNVTLNGLFADGSPFDFELGSTPGFSADYFDPGATLTVTLVSLPGDYNVDGSFDAADYVLWRKTGINGQPGYNDWRSHFGQTAMGGGSLVDTEAAVPEPTAYVVVSAVLVVSTGISRRWRRTR